jgi:curved DNA-binding protein CbpA
LPTQDAIPEFDLYAEVGVPFDADARTIEDAWRTRVRASHPDRARRGNDREATERTARLNIAREWLIDPYKRARYDRLRRPHIDVDLPDIDPLASWPERRSSSARIGRVAWLGLASVALVVLLGTVAVGIGTSYVTVAAFALSLILLTYFGMLGFLARSR